MFDYYRRVTELLKQYLAKDNKPILSAHEPHSVRQDGIYRFCGLSNTKFFGSYYFCRNSGNGCNNGNGYTF